MADNTLLNTGSGGDTIATDDIAGIKHQRVKVQYGVDGAATDVSDTNPLPIDDAGGSLTVDGTVSVSGTVTVDGSGVTQPVSGTVTANLSATDNTVLDNIDTNTAAIVNAEASALGSGVLVQGDDGTDRKNINVDATTGDVQVDVTNTVTVTATNLDVQSGGADLSTAAGQLADGHNVTIDNAAGASAVNVQDGGNALTIDWAGAAPPIGAGTEAEALRVTVATDSTGVVSIDDNGGSLTIDGTVTANLSGTDNTVLDNIDTNTGAIVAAEATALGSGVLIQGDDGTDRKNINVDATTGDVQVDVTNTVTVGAHAVTNAGTFAVQVDAALPAGTNGIGKLTANSGVDIGDVDVTSLPALVSGSSLVGDVGLSGARTSGGTTFHKNIDVDETEDAVKASAGQIYWIHAMNLTGSTIFLKFYNATVATVVVGTTIPELTFPIATQGDTNGAGFTLSIPNGIAFGTAITVACTTGLADNDSGAPAANACVLNLGFA